MRIVFCFALLLPLISTLAASKRFIVHYESVTLNQSVTDGSSTVRALSQDKEIKRLDENELAKLRNNPFVKMIEEDILLKPVSIPNPSQNTYYNSYQWNLKDSLGGIAVEDMWALSTGHTNLTIAVIDTGILNHPDLSGVINGADFVSDVAMGNDGDGRDMDATDAGDWVESGDSCYEGSFKSSSWHGTHVTGIVAASNNAIGISGINLTSKVLAIRALGKCGGYMSDIADAIRWAAGGSVSGVSDNPNPAQVINLSLGGLGSCSSTMQGAIDFARKQGAVVVVAAGNSSINLDDTAFTPASCKGVITVGASNSIEEGSSFSNYGEAIDIYAPGGESGASIVSLNDNGITTASSSNYVGMVGTSMAAPHIAGIVSLMMSVAPGLYPYQIEDILRQTAKSQICNLGPCKGFVDGFAAMELAMNTTPDESFVGVEPVAPSNPGTTSNEPRFEVRNGNGGAACGSVSTKENNFFFSVLLGVLVALAIGPIKSRFLLKSSRVG